MKNKSYLSITLMFIMIIIIIPLTIIGAITSGSQVGLSTYFKNWDNLSNFANKNMQIQVAEAFLKCKNVYCYEPGVHVREGWHTYKVGSVKELNINSNTDDAILAYIINDAQSEQGTAKNANPTDVKWIPSDVDKSNVWCGWNERVSSYTVWLYKLWIDQGHPNVSAINTDKLNDGNYKKGLIDAGRTKLQEAINKVGNVENRQPTIRLQNIENNEVKISVTGKFTKFKIFTNKNSDDSWDYYGEYTKDKNKEWTLNISNNFFNGNTAKAKIEVTDTVSQIKKVQYVELTAVENGVQLQTLRIFKINGQNDNPHDEDSITMNTDVSLQKYIYSVNGNKVSNGDVKYYLRGDVDRDGDVDYSDIKEISNYASRFPSKLSEIKDENTRKYIADLDNNGKINTYDALIVKNMAGWFTSKELYYFDDNGNVQYCLADSIKTKTDLRKNTVLRPTPNGDLDEKNCYEYGYWNSSIPNATSGLEAKYPKSVYSYKQLNPVKIKVGDEVTYKITVYNNSNVDATNVVLRDAIVGLDYIDVSSIKVTGIENGEVFNLNQGESDTYKKLYITLNKLPKNSKRDIYVTLKYNKGYYDKDGVLNNEVEIASTTPKNETQYRTYDGDSIKFKKPSVSLEKFVSQIYSNDEGWKGNELSGTNPDDVTTYNRSGKRYNTAEGVDRSNKENYNNWKENNPYYIENGDKVIFTIRVKNTGEIPVKITQIQDTYTNKSDPGKNNKMIYEGVVSAIQYTSNGKRKGQGDYGPGCIYDNSMKDNISNYGHFEIDEVVPALRPNEYMDIKVKFLIKSEASVFPPQPFSNIAKISGITDEYNTPIDLKYDSDGTDNNQDEDHIKLKEYKVSLEKFVTKVESADRSEKQSITGREGKRYNYDLRKVANPSTENFNTYKLDNPVPVEDGDIITFTIRLKNTGKNKVKITQIDDWHSKKLSLDTNNDSIDQVEQKNDGEGKDPHELITFKNPVLLDSGEYVDIDIKYTINAGVNNTTINFYNKAKIVEDTLKNKNGYKAWDCDGTDNNQDEDHLKLKTYAVSLEKYIEKVVTSNGDIKDGLNREGQAEHAYDNDQNTQNNYKETHVVDADCGSYITYVIKINNDGDTKVKFLGVQDYLPVGTTQYQLDTNGTKTDISSRRNIYIVNVRSANKYQKVNDSANENKNSYNTDGITLKPGETKEFKVTIKTEAPNLSLDVYKNTAQIDYIQNRNGIDIIDTTQNNNKDSDYFKMNSSTTTPTSVKVLKEWARYSENEKFEVEVGLYENGNLKDKQKLNKNNAWTYVWNNLNKDATYTVDELTTGNFVKKIEKISDVTWKITNSKKVQPDKTKVTVKKDWNDENNKAGRRPNSITVALYRNGIQQGGEVTLNNRNSWKNTWNNLDKYDEDGNEYVYTVKEIKIPDGYSSSISFSTGNNVTTIKITNTFTSEKVSKTVIKKWEDENNKYGNRPSSIKVGLYAGNTKKEIVTLNSSNSWSHTWNNLDKYSNGKEIVYTVKELDENNNPVNDLKKIGNYMVKYDFSTECDIITNTYNVTDVSVYKKWDVKNQALSKPIEVILYQNNNEYERITLNGDNKWNKWYHKWPNLPKYDGNGVEYRYTIKEATLENIESRIYKISENEFKLVNEEVIDQDFIISGIVWNDVAFDKDSSNYNGKYDSGENKDKLLENIKVYLYRIGVSKAVAQTTTDSNGYYRFRNIDLDPNVITDPTERHIKAKVSSTTDNKWDKTYYSYIVKFEYDGIKYTSTFKDKKRWWKIDDNSTASQYAAAQYSNAEEKESDRKELNDRFSTINNRSGINYETINVSDDRIPQSRYTYDSSTMSITSSTNTINIADYKDKELTLQHVNLGLRGRDTLDLELTSDVYSVDVTVNEQTGTYYYNNEVTIAKDDIGVYQDAANITNERYTDKDGNDINLENINNATVNQNVRATDIYNEAYGNGNTGLGINVTYKITVLNSGVTDARATKIVNYYDNRYEFVKATYDGNELPSKITKGENGYSECLITTNGSMLANGASMNIYVTYKLNEATKTDLKKMDINGELATYNMSEIYQYQSQCAKGQSVFTRGLIDVDSAPGSANTEKARLKGNKTDNKTTVQYYFDAENTEQLKCEDDTYATPVLYFVKDDSKRKLSGNVFEDLTTVNAEKVKTGNGIKDDNEKINVYGATVELLENGTVLRYRTTTDTDGNYSFEGFLPGNYMVRFRYGDTDNTVILKTQSDKINPKSFNGEDYQATNNTGEYGAKKISDRQDYWYLDNENGKVSTATDNTARRVEISNNVYNDPDIMNVLNDIRDGKKRADCGADKVDNLIEKTKMYADTKSLLINVEKAFLENNEVKQSNSFGNYAIGNMNFGIAEVPVSTIDLQKHVDELEIVDSAGINTIAKIKLQNDNKYKVYAGEVLAAGANEPIDVSIENEKLQGAKLRITYVITANINAEKNFDGKEVINPTINGLVDFIDNNLEYNDTLGENSKYWQLISYDDMQKAYNSLKMTGDSFTPASTVVNNANTHKVIIEAKEDNPILKLKDGATSVKLVLEKVLSSNDSGIEGIKMDTQNMFGYGNIIEIKGLTYNTPKGQGENPLRDRVRTTDRHIIVPGGSRDTATSEEIVIHPPTGDGGAIGITYYIVGLASLCILAIGVFGIKKFIIKR